MMVTGKRPGGSRRRSRCGASRSVSRRARERRHRPGRAARGDPCAARGERRRQDDPDEHPLRACRPRRRRDPARRLAASPIDSPSDAIRRGISMVHQHFMLVPVLSVADNMLLGRGADGGPDLPESRGSAQTESAKLGATFGWEIDPDAEGRIAVGRLAAADRDPQGPLSEARTSWSSTSRLRS